MKNRITILSILTLVLISAMAFTTSTETQNTWSEWQNTKCLKGVSYKVKMGKYNMSRRARKWEIQFKNRYNAVINFNYKAISTAQMKNYLSLTKHTMLALIQNLVLI